MSNHKPWTVEDLEDWEGLNFDLIVTLSPEAHHKALELTRTVATEVEYWPTPDPAGVEGSREQQLEAYRNVRDALSGRIRQRFRRREEAYQRRPGSAPGPMPSGMNYDSENFRNPAAGNRASR